MTAAATTAPAACNLLPFISFSFKAMTPLARYNITPRWKIRRRFTRRGSNHRSPYASSHWRYSSLLGLADNLPGARVLDDRFSAAEMSIALPKGRPAALAYVSEFVEQSKKSGTVQRAIDAAKLRGVRVAP